MGKSTDKMELCKKEALRNINLADHILTQTFSIVKDAKILFPVVDHLYKAMGLTIDRLLYYERQMKAIPPFHDNYESKMALFEKLVIRRYKIPNGYIALFKDLKKIVEAKKDFPTEFAKKSSLILADDKYEDILSIRPNELKNTLSKAKVFIFRMNNLIDHNERFF